YYFWFCQSYVQGELSWQEAHAAILTFIVTMASLVILFPVHVSAQTPPLPQNLRIVPTPGVDVSPNTATLSATGRQQFNATAWNRSGNQIPNLTFSWISSNSSAASIDASGFAIGQNTGSTALTTNITASYNGMTSNPAVLTVSASGPGLVGFVPGVGTAY